MSLMLTELATRLRANGVITIDDTSAVRRIVWPDGMIDPAEADAIFDLNSAVRSTSDEWVAFFIEAITHYVVHQQTPVGYVDETKASWLIKRIDADGRVETRGELELLVKVLEDAVSVPHAFKAYVLAQVRDAVKTGTGPTRDGSRLDANCINAFEVQLLRRVLYAQGSDGPAHISRDEANLLFEIKDVTLGSSNAPEWGQFFVQAIGKHLLTHAAYVPPDRDEEIALDAFMEDNQPHIGRFFSKMTAGGLQSGFRMLRTADRAQPVSQAEEADGEMTVGEQAWLSERFKADGRFDPLETRLLVFLSEETGHPITTLQDPV